jgi:hypothetical protein
MALSHIVPEMLYFFYSAADDSVIAECVGNSDLGGVISTTAKGLAVSDSDCDVSEIKKDVVADTCGFGPDSNIGSGDNAGDAFVLASEGCVFVISRWCCLIYFRIGC